MLDQDQKTISVPVYLASITNIKGQFSNINDDGILGLANKQLGEGIPVFMDQLANFGLPNMLSFCFGRYTGGILSLGDDLSRMADPNGFSYRVPMDTSMGYYGVRPSTMRMGSSEMFLDASTYAIVDSGTTLLLADPSVASKARSYVLASANQYLDSDTITAINQVMTNSDAGLFT